VEGGLGTVFVQNRSRLDAGLATILLGAFGWIAAGMAGLIAGGLAVAGTLIFSIWCRRKIGGFTGDTLGAACEIAELAPALVGAAWLCANGGAR
jgi:adenosylcobinamide-GDP ribazoletransferase